MITRRQFLKGCASSLLAISVAELMWQMPISSGMADQQIPVLLYHRVGKTTDPLTVTPGRFERDLRQLKEAGYSTIDLRQFERFLADRDTELPAKPLLITFDDGYRDNYENAFPLLSKYQMEAAFFIIAGMLGEPERVSAADIREMAQHGMTIGSHTVTHRPLGELSVKEMRTEMYQSRRILENALGMPVASIAYPRGSYSNDTIDMADDFGYSSGFTTLNGKCSKGTHPFALRRIPIFSYDCDVLDIIDKNKTV
ncbi:MAG: polysaccharide deacetylase [Firmicutes bacterium]|nr:polysaccharide deacetylase [Bacillota bacterium]